jgi:hypothetical protein
MDGIVPYRLKSVSFDGIQSQSNEMQFIKFLLLESKTTTDTVQISVHNEISKSMEVLSSELNMENLHHRQRLFLLRKFAYLEDCINLEILFVFF